MPTKSEIGNRKGSISPEVVRAIDYLYIDVLKTRPKMPRIKPKSGDVHITRKLGTKGADKTPSGA